MSITLYRKYRPQSFADVVGREAIKTILTEELKTGRIAHAYLFSGTRGTGKTSIARIFAKALNCTKRDPKTSEPCNECDSCTAITKGNNPDVIEIDAASNRRIDEMRELREQVKYMPAHSEYKVYIIDEVHMLTNEAFNALLKTLEEPPSHVVFILATTELHKIPDTIFSRCQHFSFGKLSHDEITHRVTTLAEAEQVKLAPEIVTDIARKSNGALRDAESLLGQILSIGKKDITYEDAQLFLPRIGFDRAFAWIQSLLEKNTEQALTQLQAVEDDGFHVEFFLQESLEIARQLLLHSVMQEQQRLEQFFSAEQITQVNALLAHTSPQHIRLVLVELLKASNDMKLSVDLPILPIEIAVVLICEGAGVPQQQQKAPMQQAPQPVAPQPAPTPEPPTPTPAPVETIVEKPAPVVEEPVATITEEIKEPTPEAAPKPSAPTGTHSLEEILAGWGEVLAKVKDKNQSLNFVLNVAAPVAVADGTVELGFKYKLQQEKMTDLKNRELVEQVISEVYGASYLVEATFKDDIDLSVTSKETNIAKPSASEEKMVKAALDVFDGAVLE